MRRRDEQPSEEDGHEGFAAWMPVLAALPLLLVGLFGASLMMQWEGGRPSVGDMVVFQPGSPDRELWRVAVVATTVPDAMSTSRTCILNSRVMVATGGSLVIEARLPGKSPRFRLHWAGPRTAHGDQDCGPSADLLVDRVDLRKLATAAGGFGVGRKGMIR
ncbi:MAG: hypothetical protein AB7O80_22215 [Acetobacteraceae bacterium]